MTIKGTLNIVVIVPTYNEEANILETIESLIRIKPDLNALECDLLIYLIDDGSTDNTVQLAGQTRIDRIIKHKTNYGLGSAVRSGLTAAQKDKADIAVKLDADLQHDPNDIISLVRPILDDEADIVYGNRFEKIGYKMPLIRRAGNGIFTSLMKFLTTWQIEDSQPGIFAVNSDYLKIFNIPGDYNYTQQILLDAYHKGMRFTHVPVSFQKRKKGKSFISLKYPLKVLPQMLLVIISIKPMKIFIPLGLSFLLLASVIFSAELVFWMAGKTIKPVLHVNAVLGLIFLGIHTFFFGLLAELIVRTRERK